MKAKTKTKSTFLNKVNPPLMVHSYKNFSKVLKITILLFILSLFSLSTLCSQTVKLFGVEMEYNGRTVVEPKSNVDIKTAKLSDFKPEVLTQKYSNTRTTYKLSSGQEVLRIHSENPGKTIYIVAGVHGDERAGWYAGNLLKEITIKEGDLFIISPANEAGAQKGSRYYYQDQDLNRAFPGDPNGTEAQKAAYAIYSDIEQKKPFMVLDLHEAIIYQPNQRDFLGCTFIFTNLNEIGDLFFDLLFATQDGEVCHNEFGYTGPGTLGSLNNVVSNKLGIDTITVETFRGFDMDRRVYDQIDTVFFCLKYLNMR